MNPAPTRLDRLRAAAEHCLALGAGVRRRAADVVVPEMARRFDALLARIVECEAGGYTRAEIGDVVWPVREMLAQSSLFRRLQFSPRGHQGDHETLERLGAGRNLEPVGTLGHVVEEMLLRGTLAAQYRARLALQGAALRETLAARRDARVLVLGAGAAHEVRQLAERGPRPLPGRVVLHDEDPAALSFARERLGASADAFGFVAGEPLRSVERLAAHGAYDLVLAGPLLDGMPDGHAVALLHAAHAELLAPGGRLLVTAAATGAAHRPCLDYFTDWVVYPRAERELARLCQLAGTRPGELSLASDPGTHLLTASVRRAVELRRVA